MQITWTTALVDLPAPSFDLAADFWAGVTGTLRSASPDHGSVLQPADGDPSVLLRRTGDGSPRVGLQLQVDDPAGAVAEAVTLGAGEVPGGERRTLRSPGGFVFTFTPTSATRRPPVPTWPGGHRSALDQVCLDVAPDRHHAELRFWTDLTGWSARRQESREFTALLPPVEQPVQLLVQRLDEGDGATTAHLDLGTSSGGRDAEVTRHVALGAIVVGPGRGWTVLRDPAGTTYCVTDHEPR